MHNTVNESLKGRIKDMNTKTSTMLSFSMVGLGGCLDMFFIVSSNHSL